MIVEFKFPKPSANVENATLTAWLKGEGERVVEGEIVAEITTDKGAIEVEAPVSGVLRRIVAEAGSMLPVGYVIGLIGDVDDALPDVGEKNSRLLAAFAARAGDARGRRAGRSSAGESRRLRVRATPAARRLARELGLDLAEVAAEKQVDAVDEAMVQGFVASRRG